MILVLCTACAIGIRVTGEPIEVDFLVGPSSEYWPDRFPCPVCSKLVTGFPEPLVDDRIALVTRIVDLNPQEAFAAFHGLGLPEELNCTIEAINKQVRLHAVKSFSGRNVFGTTRCIIDYVEFVDGSRVYLGAGAEGACGYRFVLAPSYAKKVHDD